MQADVVAFLALNVDAHFIGSKARRVFLLFRLRPDHVIGRAGRDSLGEFAAMVRIKLPASLLLIGAADFYLHAINRLVALPHGSENEGVRLNGLAGIER